MKDVKSDLNHRIARRVSELRAAKGYSLDELAHRSGVSRSMISLVERGESSPTAVVLEKLSAGLGVLLASFFNPGAAEASANSGPIARAAAQPVWRDPGSGYVRRNVSPPESSQPMQIVEVQFPAKARVAFETGARGIKVYQQIWILAGAMEITHGSEQHCLAQGDCLAMELDRPTLFYNPTRKTTRYLVVTVSESNSRR